MWYLYQKDVLGNICKILDSNGTVVVQYKYDAWGNHTIETVEPSYLALAEINPFRYRSYYYDSETKLYYLKSRYYDPEIGRFISIDGISYLNPDNINGLNLYAYCFNNPISYLDPDGTAPKWWEWLISVVTLIAGIVLCFVPGGQSIGVSLVVAGGSMLVSNIMSAVGVDGKVASIIYSGLNIIAGVALCFTPFAGIGASMIGSGVGGIAGGFISEALGYKFELGATIGGFIGDVAGGYAYRGITSYRLSHMSAYDKGAMGERYVKAVYGNKVYKPTTGANRPDLLYKNRAKLIEVKNVATQGMTNQLRRYLNMGYGKNIIYVRLGTKISSTLKSSSYIIKYFPW